MEFSKRSTSSHPPLSMMASSSELLDKKQVLAQLRGAKSAHIKWRSYAQAMVTGIPVSAEQLPVIHTDCTFGRWYYGAGQRLSSLESYQAIEVPHEALHAIYIEIYKLINHIDEPGYISKLKGKQKRHASRKAIPVLLYDLIEMSKTLLSALELLEQEVMRIDEAQFRQLL